MKVKAIMISLVAVIALAFAGCGDGETDTATTDEESTGTWSITVEVVDEKTVEITNDDVSEIGAADITAAVKDGDSMLEADTFRGIKLYDLLDYVGVEEFSVLSIEAVDGYSVEMEPDRINPDGTGFAWAVNGDMLDAESGPIELVNDGRGSKHWVKQVAKIVIIQ